MASGSSRSAPTRRRRLRDDPLPVTDRRVRILGGLVPFGRSRAARRPLASGPVSVTPWTASDEGYLRAYRWTGALAGGAPMPQEAARMPLGPGEVAHVRVAPV